MLPAILRRDPDVVLIGEIRDVCAAVSAIEQFHTENDNTHPVSMTADVGDKADLRHHDEWHRRYGRSTAGGHALAGQLDAVQEGDGRRRLQGLRHQRRRQSLRHLRQRGRRPTSRGPPDPPSSRKDPTMTFVLVVVGAFGLAVGSFVNVVVHRLPRGESLLRPASNCPQCTAPVRPWHNFPVVGWLLLRGRCADCAALIGIRHPLVELGTAALFVAVAARFVAPPSSPRTARTTPTAGRPSPPGCICPPGCTSPRSRSP
ncbi:prepilin peptidase [Dactylosporangium darangshiense]|uniref:prepilin peptidase n=1 Tax=Dactylosporangium darangshiense TaxID=579108 RepID=UPI0036373CD7